PSCQFPPSPCAPSTNPQILQTPVLRKPSPRQNEALVLLLPLKMPHQQLRLLLHDPLQRHRLAVISRIRLQPLHHPPPQVPPPPPARRPPAHAPPPPRPSTPGSHPLIPRTPAHELDAACPSAANSRFRSSSRSPPTLRPSTDSRAVSISFTAPFPAARKSPSA